ncbi:MAG: S-methyl-5'-thioadenosine phosphorylase [Bacteroidales bacterium]
MKTIGIIGGSGLDKPEILQNAKEVEVVTPFGNPSSTLKIGNIGNCKVVLLSRHGYGHQYSPTEVNYRANIYAMKEQNVDAIIATTACGSLRQEIGRGDFVLLDQFIDFTKKRANTFFDSFATGISHPGMAYPFDKDLREIILTNANKIGIKMHSKGTVVTIEGPRFSTRAESMMFRSWGADVINMSIATEASLANELQIPYAAIAMSTDYDCWKDDEPPVSWEEVLKVFSKNANNVIELLVRTIKSLE